MQFVSVFRRIVPIAAIAALVLMASCNSGSKKYGCPNHLSISLSLR